MTNPEHTASCWRPGPFSGPAEFTALVRSAIACAAREGWKQMVWCDTNFEDWPLREKAVVDDLHAWASSGRKLVLLAQSFDSVRALPRALCGLAYPLGPYRGVPRLPPPRGHRVPSVLWSPHWFMHRLDLVRHRGVSSYEAQTRVTLQEELEEFRRQGTPGFPATRLGL